MNRAVLRYPSAALKLRQKSSPVDIDSAETSYLIDDLYDSFRILEGYGLAAPQIGIFKRAIIIGPRNLGISDEEVLLMLNPSVTLHGEEELFKEACFSVPYVDAFIKRSNKCVVTYTSDKGDKGSLELTGLPAACIQHEIDHLDGMLYIDRLSHLKRQILLKKIKKIEKREKKVMQEKRREFMEDHESLQYGYDVEKKAKTTYSKKRKLKARRKRSRSR